MLEFSVSNQTITRTDDTKTVAKSRDYLYAYFDFKTDEWKGIKTAVFIRDGVTTPPMILDGDNKCRVPWEWLDVDEVTIGYVSVYCGNLVTTDKALVEISASGYTGGSIFPPTPDVYTQIIGLINSLGLDYEDNVLSILQNGGETVTISGGGGTDAKQIELRNSGTHIQWRHIGEAWRNLIAIADLKGANGKDGKDGTNGVDGTNGLDGSNGKDGKDGIDGTNGVDGTNGTNGIDGKDGADGENGVDGIDGTNGLDGKDGKNGEDGINGTDGKDGAKGDPGTQFKTMTDAQFRQTTPDPDTFYFIKGQ